MVNDIFNRGEEVYRGYIDDSRNTDNSWIESVVVNFHDDIGSLADQLNLKPNERKATKAKWLDVEKADNLFSIHDQFLKDIAYKHHAHF